MNQKCTSSRIAHFECKEGFVRRNNSTCLDINECFAGKNCHEHAKCSNSVGDFSCTCEPGYAGNETNCTKASCRDALCGTNEHCVSKICTNIIKGINFRRYIFKSNFLFAEIVEDDSMCLASGSFILILILILDFERTFYSIGKAVESHSRRGYSSILAPRKMLWSSTLELF